MVRSEKIFYMVNKDEFRRKVIITAGQIFSRYGFKKTTMDEIAKALKMGKSSIYYYFESKEDIFEAVVLHEANILRTELTTAIKSVESPIDKMRNYVFVRMKSFEKLSNYYNAIFDKNLDHFEFIETIRQEVRPGGACDFTFDIIPWRAEKGVQCREQRIYGNGCADDIKRS